MHETIVIGADEKTAGAVGRRNGEKGGLGLGVGREIGVILVRGAVETLEYFSGQMAACFAKAGCTVWFWDMKSPRESREGLKDFCRDRQTVLLTFNFIGLSGEPELEEDGQTLWQRLGVRVYCIMVDHPIYYRKQLRFGDPDWRLFCVDRDHAAFVTKMYPEYGNTRFLPLAGTKLPEDDIQSGNFSVDHSGDPPYGRTGFGWGVDRPIDVLFAGNYVQMDMLKQRLSQLEADNQSFLWGCIERLIADPGLTIEQVAIEGLLRELPDLSKDELLDALYHFVVVDLYVRSYYRRRLVCGLAEEGIRIHVIGKDWNRAGCRKAENLIVLGQRDSRYCLQRMRESKMSLNIIPWFKNGAHDRVFNGMLQRCVTVTDSSLYLDGLLTEGKHYLGYTLSELRADGTKDLARRMKSALSRPEQLREIAENGFALAEGGHTWSDRAGEVLQIINSEFN